MARPKRKIPKIKRFIKRSNVPEDVRRLVARIKTLHGLRAAMRLTDLSFKRMGEEIARWEHRGKDYSKGMVFAWATRQDHKRHQRMNSDQLDALAAVLTDWIWEQTGIKQIIVSVHVNSPLRTRLWIRCEECHRRVPLDLRRRAWTKCAMCGSSR